MNPKAIAIAEYGKKHPAEDVEKLIFLLFAVDRQWYESNVKRDKLGKFASMNGSGNRTKARQREGKTKPNVAIKIAHGCLNGYSKHQKTDWMNSKSIVVCETEKSVQEFIDAARSDKSNHKKMYMGMIDAKAARMVKEKTGVDVNGYNLAVGADEIRKIDTDHGSEDKEKKRGQRAITDDDIKTLPRIIAEADDVDRDPDGYRGNELLKFMKTMNGKTTAVAYVSVKHHDLRLQTMYSGRNK